MLFGVMESSWLGNDVPLKPGSTFTLGGMSSKPQVVGGTVDFSNAMEASEVKLKVPVQKGVPITTTYVRGVAGELQVRCDSGQTFTWENAFITGVIPVTSGDSSEMEITFGGGTPLET
jgi:hypothetical protein